MTASGPGQERLPGAAADKSSYLTASRHNVQHLIANWRTCKEAGAPPKPGEKAVHRSLSPIAGAAAGDRGPGFLGTGPLSVTAALTGSEPVPWIPKCHTETLAVAQPGAGPPSQSQLQSSSPRRSSSSFRTPLTENSAELTGNNQHSSLRINEGPFLPELRCPGFISPGLLRSAGCCVSQGPLQLQVW